MKFCVSCGAQLNDTSKFCKVCGSPQPDISNQMQQNNMQQNQMQQNQMQQGYPQQGMPQQGMPQQGMPQQFSPNPAPKKPAPKKPAGDKKSSSGLVIGLIISAVVLLLLVGTFLILVMTDVIKFGDDEEGTNSKKTESTEEPGDKDDDNDNKADASTEDSSDPGDDDGGENDSNDGTDYDSIYGTLNDKTPMSLEFVSSDVTEYPTVKVYYTVEDSSGQTLVLTSPNVAIKETASNGQELERKIVSVKPLKGNQGVSFNICADKSGSMEDSMSTMQNAMSQFVNAMDTDSGDRAELISFDTYVMYMCTYTTDKTLLQNGINNMVPDGATAFYDALYEAVMNSGNQKGARCVIAFTDGEDNSSDHTYSEVISYANSLNVPIFIIGTGTSYDSTYESIATQTGGRFWTIDSISDMSDVLTEIYNMEKDMYCIEYESDSSIDAYTQRSIKCVMTDKTYGTSSESTFTPVEALKVKDHTSRYEVIKEDISWTEANQQCIKNGGHLITITSQQEMDEAIRLSEEAGIKYVWMGGYTSVQGNSAFGHWVTGEDFSYTAWYEGEPSRYDQDNEEEMYLMLWNVQDEWSWNDQRNDVISTGLKYFPGNIGYICEYED